MNPNINGALRRRLLPAAGIGLMVLAALAGRASAAVVEGPGCADTGAQVQCEFWATSGTLSLPGATVDVMGYAATAGGTPLVPGPAIVADAGDTVTVTLHNALGEPTGMLFKEQALPPDLTGVAPGGTTTYTFTATAPGTYIYEADPFVETAAGGGSHYQAAMGMSGALVVRPADPAQAYDANTGFDAEHLVVVTELDTALTSAGAANFDMRDYAPDYFLINGKASPDTTPLAVNAGDRVLIRWIDAGIKTHSIAALGVPQRVVADDGNLLAIPRTIIAETLGAGQSEDVIMTVPQGPSRKIPLYDSGLWLNNASGAGVGGALTYLDVAGATSADTFGPGTTAVAFNPPTLTANVSDALTGGANVAAAEYFTDAVGANGSGTAMGGSFGSPAAAVTADLAVTPGDHTYYVHGQDDLGNWGPVSSVIFHSPDAAGPATRGLSLDPDPTNGTKDLNLGATGDDTATGGSAVTDGEYTIDGGAPVAIPSNGAGTVAALDAVIPAATVAAVAEGAHDVSVRSRDALGNWGDPGTITLTKDVTGPQGSAASTNPPSSNGVQGLSPTTPVVRVRVTVNDAASAGVHSAIAAGEGFIDNETAADGSGFPLSPVDGAFGGQQETLYGDIPLSTVVALSEGNHTIWLHARDSAGNWGGRVSATLLVDKHAPTVSTLTATPNPTNRNNVNFPGLTLATATNNRTFALTGTSTDNLNAVTAAEWFTGADPGVGNATPMVVTGGPAFTLSATVDFMRLGWLDGTRTIQVRSRDAAGNWSTTGSVNVDIVRPNTIFKDGFESNNGNAWSGRTGNRLSYVTQANMAGTGTRGMRVSLASGTGTAAYVTDNTPVTELSYHARFYFNPNNADPGDDTAGVVIFAGYNGDNGAGLRFTVRYRRNGAGIAQVRLNVLRTNGTTVGSTNWVSVPSGSPDRIEVFWRAGTAANRATVTLIVDPTAPALNTSTQTLTNLLVGGPIDIGSARMGVQALTGNNAGRTGNLYFDSFHATRWTAVGP